jgi:hypothetical protein
MIKNLPEEDPKNADKYPHALISFFCACYKTRYNKNPVLNRYRQKWAMVDVIDDIGYDRARKLIEYYFKLDKPNHSIDWFAFNFEKLDLALRQQEEDKTRRELIRAKTKSMVEERDNEY